MFSRLLGLLLGPDQGALPTGNPILHQVEKDAARCVPSLLALQEQPAGRFDGVRLAQNLGCEVDALEGDDEPDRGEDRTGGFPQLLGNPERAGIDRRQVALWVFTHAGSVSAEQRSVTGQLGNHSLDSSPTCEVDPPQRGFRRIGAGLFAAILSV